MSVNVHLSRLDLAPAQLLRRQPPRPVAERQPDYDLKFDFQTVFYDCFQDAEDGDQIVCIGPPLSNLAAQVTPAITRAFGKRWLSRTRVRSLDRVSELRLRPSRQIADLSGDLFAQSSLVPQPNLSELFRGRRVIMTKSRDNDLVWIRDWADFHARHHGCDAVLLYDNRSTKYGVADLHATLASVPGIATAVIVEWPFNMGPSGGGASPKAWVSANGVRHEFWDSDFSQYGVLQHARHRFLTFADAVLNCDIDELVLTTSRQSIFDLARRSRTGYLSFGGIWIENAAVEDRGDARRHRDYVHRRAPDPRYTTSKWAVVPSRCPPHAQWCVHWISGLAADDEASAQAELRHFNAITTNWRETRWRPQPPDASHAIDQEWVRWTDLEARPGRP